MAGGSAKAYAGTEVPVGRTQDAIRALLVRHGAEGVQFSEVWSRGRVGFSFATLRDGPAGKRPVAVRMDVDLGPQAERVRWSAEQRDRRLRQVWRALFYYLKSQLEAVDFGLRAFEDAFLADIVASDGRVLGDHIREALDAGTLRLPERAGE